jgi:hypothetical protein
MMGLTRGLQSLQKQVDVQTNVEQPSAALTLTRSATLAVVTTGTTITWQVEPRNSQFTWSGTTITMPTNGYYAVQVACAIAISTGFAIQRVVNGTIISMMPSLPAGTYFLASNTSYYTGGSTLQIRVGVGANTTLLLNAENAANESPILHIVQLSASV